MNTCGLEGACAKLNADRTTVLDLVDVGEIPAAKIGRSWVFREEDLDDYLAKKIREQTAERRARAEERATAERLSRKRNVSESAKFGNRTRRRREPPALPELPEPVGQPAAAQVGVAHGLAQRTPS